MKIRIKKKRRVIKDIHTERCCIKHGCRYGEDNFYCTVVNGKKPQSFPCPQCLNPNLTTLDLLKLDAKGH